MKVEPLQFNENNSNLFLDDEIKALEYSKKCAFILGYQYYAKVDIDTSDCGGIYEKCDFYSKIPIELHSYPIDNEYFLKGVYIDYLINPDFFNDWNLIMYIIEAIEKLDTLDKEKEFNREIDRLLSLPIYAKKEETIQAINEFLTWYNNNESKTN